MTDNFLKDLKLTTNDYNNGTTLQLLAFLLCEFPVQFLTKRFGFKLVLPSLMIAWGTVCKLLLPKYQDSWAYIKITAWAQAWITNRASFYVTRVFIGACEGGFIPGTILFATYFYTSKELSTRLAVFWSTLNVSTGRRNLSILVANGLRLRELSPLCSQLEF